MDEDATRPWWDPLRRRPGERLKFNAVMLVVGVLGYGFLLANVQREAVAAIRAAGGRVHYGWQVGNPAAVADSRPIWRRWVGDRLGPDYFETVVGAFVVVPWDEALIEGVGKLNRLKFLGIGGPLTDDGLYHLRGLTSLKALHLESPQLTAVGLESLQSLTGLEDLFIPQMPIDDRGLASLIRLETLRKLVIGRGDRITDEGMVHLAELPSLECLSITDASVTDAGLASLSRLTRLRSLDLRNSKVTDAGLDALRRSVPSLQDVGR